MGHVLIDNRLGFTSSGNTAVIDPDTFLANARALREKTSDYKISDEEFNQAKSAGRL